MGHGKETPRQKMIGMMYLVLTAMLALNVSADILKGFVLVDNGLVKTTANFVAKNESSYGVFNAEMEKSEAKVKPFRDKAYQVKNAADQLAYDLQELKVEIVKYCDGEDAAALTQLDMLVGETAEKKTTFSVNTDLINAKDNLDKPAEIMIGSPPVKPGKGADLKKQIEVYRELLLSMTDDPSVQKAIQESLNTDGTKDKGGADISWESSYFEHIPMVSVIAMLSKLQSDVRNAEADIIQNLLAQIGASDTKVNKMEAIIQTKSNYVLRGNEFEARVLLAAYDSLQKPEIILGPYRRTADDWEMVGEGTPVPYDARGRAMIRRTSSSVGTFPIQGLLRMMTPEGVKSYPFSSEYQVGEANAVIAADKMNVLYIGVDNPMSISVSGVPGEKVTASISQGTLTRGGGGWIAKPTSQGEVTITVSAEVDGQRRQMGSQKYRVKVLPPPVAKVAGEIGGPIDKATLLAQVAVRAILDDTEFDVQYTITEFSVSAQIGQFTQTKATKGATITAEQKQILNRLSKGQKVYFDEIKAIGPDKRIRSLPAIAFTIR